jgi:hypothetical protein
VRPGRAEQKPEGGKSSRGDRVGGNDKIPFRSRIDARSKALEADSPPSHDLRRDPTPTAMGRERQEGIGARKRARLCVGHKPLKSEPRTWQWLGRQPQSLRWNKPSRSCETARTAMSREREPREPTPKTDAAMGAKTPRKAPRTARRVICRRRQRRRVILARGRLERRAL